MFRTETAGLRIQGNVLQDYKSLPIAIRTKAQKEDVQRQQLAATRGSRQLKILIKINRLQITAIINTGAIGNFISLKEVKRLGFNIIVKEPNKIYQLTMVNRDPANNNTGQIKVEIALLQMLFLDRYYEII